MTPGQDDANLTLETSGKDPGQSSMNSQGVQGWFQECWGQFSNSILGLQSGQEQKPSWPKNAGQVCLS